MKKYYLLVLCFMIFMSACRKDEIIDTTITETVEEEFFLTTITGTVEDLTGTPVENASVRVGNKSILTDKNGIFFLENVSTSNIGTYVQVNKAGYFHAGNNIYTSTPATFKTRIVLSPYVNTVNFSANEGLDYTFQDEARVVIPPNAISLNGSAYTGDVTVHSTWLDPTKDVTYLTMPGDLTAVTAENESATLQSFGMVGVDLISDSGQRLQITEGMTATVEFPVPNELQSEANSTIALWHFDEVEGVWVEEGQASLEGNKYIANVSHFSWWNCDFAFETTLLCINFVDRLGNPFYADNILLELTAAGFGTASAYINDESQYCGIVPSGVLMELNIYTHCGTSIHTESIGPFSDVITEIEIQIFDQSNEIVTVSGLITDCDENPVTFGYVDAIDNGFSFLGDDGLYDISFVVCNNASVVELVGIDLNNFTQGTATVNIIEGQTTYTQDIACGEDVVLNPLFRWTEVPTNNILDSEVCNSRVTPVETLIISDIGILGINGFAQGTFSGNFIETGWEGITALDQTTVTITKFGEIGEYISGTFTNDFAEGIFVSLRLQ